MKAKDFFAKNEIENIKNFQLVPWYEYIYKRNVHMPTIRKDMSLFFDDINKTLTTLAYWKVYLSDNWSWDIYTRYHFLKKHKERYLKLIYSLLEQNLFKYEIKSNLEKYIEDYQDDLFSQKEINDFYQKRLIDEIFILFKTIFNLDVSKIALEKSYILNDNLFINITNWNKRKKWSDYYKNINSYFKYCVERYCDLEMKEEFWDKRGTKKEKEEFFKRKKEFVEGYESATIKIMREILDLE